MLFPKQKKVEVGRGAGSYLVWVLRSQELAVIQHWPKIRSPQYLKHCPTSGHRKKKLKKSRPAQVPDKETCSSLLWFGFCSLCKSFWNWGCTVKTKPSQDSFVFFWNHQKSTRVGLHLANYTTALATWPVLEQNIPCHIWQPKRSKTTAVPSCQVQPQEQLKFPAGMCTQQTGTELVTQTANTTVRWTQTTQAVSSCFPLWLIRIEVWGRENTHLATACLKVLTESWGLSSGFSLDQTAPVAPTTLVFWFLHCFFPSLLHPHSSNSRPFS